MLTKRAKLLIGCCFMLPACTAHAAEITHEAMNETIEIIHIEGDIVPSDVERFRQISLRYPRAFVELNSNGGALLPALEIGRTIRIAGYTTSVPEGGQCVSACALIWIAGTSRYLVGQVGFHAAYRDNDGSPEESGAGNALVGNYLTLLGLPTRAILFATTAPPDRILWLTNANREETGIDFIPPFRFTPPAPSNVPEPAQRQNPQILPNPSQAPIENEFSILSVTYHQLNDGTQFGWYRLKYRGITLERPSFELENPEDDLRDDLESHISGDGGWVNFSDNGLLEGNAVFYYIHVPSIIWEDGVVEFWVKNDHRLDQSVPHRESITFGKIFCETRQFSYLEEYFYNANGHEIRRELYSAARERIIPNTVDEDLWTTVCAE